MIRKIPCIKFEMGLSGLLVKIISLPYNLLDLERAECNDAGKKLRNCLSHYIQPVEKSTPSLAKPADFTAEMTGGLVSFGVICQCRIFFATDLLRVRAAGMEVAARGRVDR